MKKKLLKILLVVLIILVLAAVGFLIWYFLRETPSKVLMGAANAAQIEDEEAFKSYFSKESIEALELAWKLKAMGRTRGNWKMMMRGLLTKDELLPEVINEAITEPEEEGSGPPTAIVTIKIGDDEHDVDMIKEDGHWKIHVIPEIDLEAAKRRVTSPTGGPDGESEPTAEDEWWWEE